MYVEGVREEPDPLPKKLVLRSSPLAYICRAIKIFLSKGVLICWIELCFS
jgi:hypothetical protein